MLLRPVVFVVVLLSGLSAFGEGELDSGFLPPALTEAEGPANIHGVAHQNFGKVVIAGSFDTVDGVQTGHITRLMPDGSVDSSFQAGDGANGAVRCVAVLEDQKLLIGGDFTEFDGMPRARIARLHPDGELDLSFDPGSGFDATVHSLTAGANRPLEYFVGGEFEEYDGEPRANLASIDASGSLRESFTCQTNGTVHRVTSFRTAPGRYNDVVIAGDFTEVGGEARNRLAGFDYRGELGSLNADPLGGPDGTVLAFEEIDRGVYLVGGEFTTWDGQPRRGYALLEGGRVAPTLSADSLPSLDGNVRAVASDGNGFMAIGGSFTEIGGEERLHLASLSIGSGFGATWELDPGFDAGTDGAVNGLARSVEGKVVAAGSFGMVGDTTRPGLARLLGDAGLAPPPAPTGVLASGVSDDRAIALWDRPRDVLGVRIEIRTGAEEEWVVAGVLPFGTSIVLDDLQPATDHELRVLALGSNGDSNSSEIVSFRTAELPWVGPGSPDPTINSIDSGNLDTIVLRPDDSIIAAGPFTRTDEPYGLVRYLASGAKDLSYEVGAISPLSSDRTLVAGIDGSVYIGGNFTSVGGLACDSLARVGPDGAVDPLFVPPPDLIDRPAALGLQRDGKVLVTETFPSGDRDSTIRLFPDGRLDESYSGSSDRVAGLRVLPDDRLIVWGSSMTLDGQDGKDLAVLFPDGQLDPSFPPLDLFESLGVQDSIEDVIPLSGGRWLVVAGEQIVRLLADGTPDPSFAFVDLPDSRSFPSGAVWTAAEQPNGKLLIAGSFEVLGDRIFPGIARLHPDGAIDDGFRPGVGFLSKQETQDGIRSSTPRSIVLLPDGRIVVGGPFESYDGANFKALAFITGDPAPTVAPTTPVIELVPATRGASEIRWMAVPGVFDYRLECSPDGLGDWTLCSVEGHATTRVVEPFFGPAQVHYRLVARNAAGEAVSQVVEAATNHSFANWKAGFGISEEAGEESDDDHDGRGLLEEYAEATDPTRPDISPWPRLVDTGESVGVVYPILRNDLELEVEASVALSGWSSAGVVEQGGGEFLGTVEKGGADRFLRVKLTLIGD